MNPRQPHMGVPGQIMRQLAAIGADDLRGLLDALGLGAA